MSIRYNKTWLWDKKGIYMGYVKSYIKDDGTLVVTALYNKGGCIFHNPRIEPVHSTKTKSPSLRAELRKADFRCQTK